MRGKKRPMDERARAVGIAVVAGGAEASRQTGIPENTIYDWMASPEFVELRERTKEEVAQEWWSIVQLGFRRVGELLKSEDDTQRAATATAIVTDKMLLLRGEATERSEVRDLSGVLNDHELDLLRAAVQRETATQPAAEAAVESPS